MLEATIYNSRNYYRLLNVLLADISGSSTTVEITIGYLTSHATDMPSNLQQ